jgi:hypothetical protein
VHALLQELLKIGLPEGDFALFGSGPLLVRGWIDDVGDLDVIARGTAWDHAQGVGQLSRLDQYGIDLASIGDHITIGTAWGIGDFSVGILIDEAEMIEGIPCVQLKHIIAYKRLADRPKDRVHLAVIEEHLTDGP